MILIGQKTLHAVIRSYRPTCRTYPDSERYPTVLTVELDIGEDLLGSDGQLVRGPLWQEGFKPLKQQVEYTLTAGDFQRFLEAKRTNNDYKVLASDFIPEDTPKPEEWAEVSDLAWQLYVSDHNATLPWYKVCQWAIDEELWML